MSRHHAEQAAGGVPKIHGEPILDGEPRPAFRVATQDIIESIRQQFSDRRLAFRELGQNSADAGATRIRLTLNHESDCMVAEFLDDGCGMTKEVIRNNYLTLFDSTKEGRKDCIGYYSLGRISAFVYPLEFLELITLSEGCPGYHLIIRGDYSGRLFEVEAGETARLLDSERGTLVRLRYPVGGIGEFAKEARAICDSLKSELCWLRPAVQVATCKLKDDRLERVIETINAPFAVPGRLSHTVDVKLASGLGTATVALGVEGETARLSMGREEAIESGLAPITLCIGRIPVLRANELPWTGGKPFAIQNLRVVIDSFQFKTNIGRNVVYLDTPFVRELLPKVFNQLILERYIPALAKAFVSSGGFTGRNSALRRLLCDICSASSEHGYRIPEAVFDTPFLPALYRRRDYTLRELDAAGEDAAIYHTNTRKEIDDRPYDEGGEEGGAFCISFCEMPYTFREWVERRYGDRFRSKDADFVPLGEDDRETKKLTLRLRELLAVPQAMAGLGGVMLSAEGKKCATVVSCGRLARFDGQAETRTPAHVFTSPDRAVLNLDNPHIRRLIAMLDGEHRMLAAHFLFREALFATGQKLPVAHREQLLTADLARRFRTSRSRFTHVEELLDAIGNELEPF